jgi:hypothetical protein
MRVDEGKDVHQCFEYSVYGRFSLCVLPHPPEEHPFIAAVGEHEDARVLVDGGQELLKNLLLLLGSVCPEREAVFGVTIADDHADEIIEPLLWVAFYVEIDTDRRVRELRRTEQIDPSIADREGL